MGFWEVITSPKVYVPVGISTAIFLAYKIAQGQPAEVSLTSFLSAIDTKQVREVIDYGEKVVYRSVTGSTSQVVVEGLQKSELVHLCARNGIEYFTRASGEALKRVLIHTLAMCAGLWTSIRLLSPDTNKLAKTSKHQTNVRFCDIAGNEAAKEALGEIIDYFKSPQRYIDLGATLPRGVLLFGPSGTGKTMLAKATATEAGVSFIECSGSEFIEMYAGVGARRVRDVFANARKHAPCILFIDEIDSLAQRRGASSERQGLEQHQTLNQLLTEMDGFARSENIVVLGATNRHFALDDAILRPGRFDRKVVVGLPDTQTRATLIRLKLEKCKHAVTEDTVAKVAERTEGASGAEVSGIINEAAHFAIRHKRLAVDADGLEEGLQRFQQTKKQFAEVGKR